MYSFSSYAGNYQGVDIRNSSKYLIFTGLNLLLFLGFTVHSVSTGKDQQAVASGNIELAGRLGLTDLCLFTEARYTRHPAMADNHAPFQEHPAAFDHFPSGSILMPLPSSRGHR